MHVALDLRAGQSALFAFELAGHQVMMIGTMMASKVHTGKVSTENRLWKHVTELAVLPPSMAATFCQHALNNYSAYEYWSGNKAHRRSASPGIHLLNG